MLRGLARSLVLGALLCLLLGSAAWAYWTTNGTGEAPLSTASFTPPSDVTAEAPLNSSTVDISWTRGELSTGQPAPAHYVTRVRDSDGTRAPACGTSAAEPTSASSCADTGVTDGRYHYLVTAVLESWTALSGPGGSVNVVNDTSRPSVTVTSVSPAPNEAGYTSSSPVLVTLSASSVIGIQSLTYTLDAGPAVTVSADTAAVQVSGDGVHTISYSAVDTLGTPSTSGSVLVRIDTVAPEAPTAPVLTTASDSGTSTTDAITNVVAPTFTGTAEDGATVTLFDGSTPVGTGVPANGTYTIKSSSLTAGGHTMTARVVDAAGNVSPISPGTTITVDTTAPPVPSAPSLTAASDSGTSSSDRNTNVTTPTFTGTAESSARVILYNASTAVGSATATSAGYSVTTSALTGGAKSITARTADVAGNLSAASPVTNVVIDITAPNKPGTPVMAAASDTGRSSTDRNTSSTTPTFTGTATAGSIVTLFDGTVQLGTVTIPSTAWSLTAPTLAEGAHIITARATDVAGNQSVSSTAVTATIDTTAPVTLAAPNLSASSDTGRSSSDRITNRTTPVFTGTNETRALVILSEAAIQLGSVTTTGTTWSITSSALSPGSHTLTATPVDIAGNRGPASSGTTVTIDTTPPAAPPLAPELNAASDTGDSATDAVTNDATPTFTGKAEDGITVTLLDGATATGTAVTATGGAYTATTGTLTNGSHTIAARASDVAGNLSTATSGTTLTVDTVVPTGALDQASSQADPTSTSPVNFTALFSEPVSGFTSADVTLSGTAAPTSTTITGSGANHNVAVGGMTKTGTVIATIAAGRVTDVAGNLNTAVTVTDNTVTYNDTTAPAAPSAPALAAASDTGLSASDRITKTTTPTFTGTTEIGSTVRLFDGPTQVGSVVTATTTYSLATTGLANGSHTVTATATDSSGNVSTASDSTTLTIDTVLPTVTLNQSAGQTDPTTSSPITFSVLFNEAVTGFTSTDVTVSGTAGATTVLVSGSGTGYTATASGMTRTGTVIGSVATGGAVDVAGNANAAASYTDRTVTFTDGTAPVVTISGFTAATDGSQTATVTGTGSRGAGDNQTVTVVLCTVNTFPCLSANTKATFTGVPVNPTTGSWSATSAALGTNPQLYARATQADLTGNGGNSAVAGPVTTG